MVTLWPRTTAPVSAPAVGAVGVPAPGGGPGEVEASVIRAAATPSRRSAGGLASRSNVSALVDEYCWLAHAVKLPARTGRHL